jgi:acetyltransferase-like isoleucine patch superfamily enzyme
MNVDLFRIGAWARNLEAVIIAKAIRGRGVECDPSVRFVGWPIITLHPDSRIALGRRSRIVSLSRYTALGVSRPTVLRTMAAGASLCIGDDVGISGSSICAAKSIVIGDRVRLGSEVIIADTDFHGLSAESRGIASRDHETSQPVEIGSDVFVGARATILKGARIGPKSVIGAGSVVTGLIPGGVVAAGNPCRVIRKI